MPSDPWDADLADAAMACTLKRIGKLHDAAGNPDFNDEFDTYECAINAAYMARDLTVLRRTLSAFERSARRFWSGQQRLTRIGVGCANTSRLPTSPSGVSEPVVPLQSKVRK